MATQLTDLRGTIGSNWNLIFTKANAALTDDVQKIIKEFPIPFSFGAGDSQANTMYAAQLVIAPSATTTLTLSDLSLIDVFGDTIALTEIKAFRIFHVKIFGQSTSINVLGNFVTSNFGASTSYPLTQNATWHDQTEDGRTVTGTTGDVIDLLNNDGSNQATVIVNIIGN